jgi:hypothetical protein
VCDEEMQTKLVEILRPYLGPISPVLVKKGLLHATDHESLLSTLSSAIDDDKESNEFLVKARSLFLDN